MRRRFGALLLLGILGSAAVSTAQGIIPGGDEPHKMPAGITCCDEQKIRLAMTEEALARIVARSRNDSREPADYLSGEAYRKIRHRLPPGSREERVGFLRDLLLQPTPDSDGGEFQTLVGHFILGMTLEIGQTFQDEYDQALAFKEKIGKLLAGLERSPEAATEELGRLLFQADISEKELRRWRALETRWQAVRKDASPFDEFNALKKNVTGRATDPDQRMAFDLAERYRGRFPFLDEFLENYRALAKGFQADVWSLKNHLTALEE